MQLLINRIKNCTLCEDGLPHAPRPVLTGSTNSRIIIIGQAPGRKVHESGIPWNDPSGDLLRTWMGIDKQDFYDPEKIALIPMGFCYPGKGKSGDLPPRPECAPQWHTELMGHIAHNQLTVLIGQYSQKYYLGRTAKSNLTETVRHFEMYLPSYFVLPHPSPRNRLWLKKNPWFDEEVVPAFRTRVQAILANDH